MSGAEIGLAISVYLACAVEAVEALTIVLAVGQTRSWSSSLSGAGAAIVLLGGTAALLGGALARLPIDVAEGAHRRAAARGRHPVAAQGDPAGRGPEGDARRARRLRVRGRRRPQRGRAPHGRFDGYSFAVAFKGVLLEGLEVAIIVITFGANAASHRARRRGRRARRSHAS